MSASELELLLHDLAGEVDWPPTPAFRAVPARRRPRWATAALIAAAAVLVFGAAAWASDRLLHAVTIQRVEHLPTPSPSVDPLLGRIEPSVAAASADAGFTVSVPAALGSPDEVRLRQVSGTRIVTLIYRPRPGIPPSAGDPTVGAEVSEFAGAAGTAFVGKLVGPGTTVRQVDVGGAQGVWIAGSPHEVFIPNAIDQLRLATNTLLWERGGVTYRLEADVPLADALRIAGTIR